MARKFNRQRAALKSILAQHAAARSKTLLKVADEIGSHTDEHNADIVFGFRLAAENAVTALELELLADYLEDR